MASKGTKIRAGTMLSEFIRQIANESSEMVQDPEQGDKMATKAEALARIVWKSALGYEEQEERVTTQGQKVLVNKRYPPAQWAISMVYERAEGRAAQVGDTGEKNPSTADKINARNKDRINKLSEKLNAGSNDKSAPVDGAIPQHPRHILGPPDRSKGAKVKRGPASSVEKRPVD